MASNILSNCPFITAKQASKMHMPELLLNDCSSIQVSKLLFVVVKTSKLSADVVCRWLKTISTSGRAVHFTLSRNYPEILGCRQHLPALSG